MSQHHEINVDEARVSDRRCNCGSLMLAPICFTQAFLGLHLHVRILKLMWRRCDGMKIRIKHSAYVHQLELYDSAAHRDPPTQHNPLGVLNCHRVLMKDRGGYMLSVMSGALELRTERVISKKLYPVGHFTRITLLREVVNRCPSKALLKSSVDFIAELRLEQ
jgi:hypothetical protein